MIPRIAPPGSVPAQDPAAPAYPTQIEILSTIFRVIVLSRRS